MADAPKSQDSNDSRSSLHEGSQKVDQTIPQA